MEEGNLQHKHSTCVWKKNIFFEQTRLSASFPRSTIISAQCCFQKERKKKKNHGPGTEGKEKKLFSLRTNAPGLQGPLQGAAGWGQWARPGCSAASPTLGPGASSEPASLISRGWQHLAQSHPRVHGPGPQTPHGTYCALGLGRCDPQELRLQAAQRAL